MTALAANRTPAEVRWKYKIFTLTSGQVAWQGASIFFNTATQKCVIGAAGEGLIFLGFAVEKTDATSADTPINVDLIDEIVLNWFPNATASDAVASTDLIKDCYALDDQTVTITSKGNPPVGRVWAVDTVKGVLVQKLVPAQKLAAQPTLGAYASNDNIPAGIINGAIYDVPTTAAASTITLPVAAPDGTVATFVADGTKNGHTVQYRDATGPTNLTAALTASKRHMVIVAKRDGKWFANAMTSP